MGYEMAVKAGAAGMQMVTDATGAVVQAIGGKSKSAYEQFRIASDARMADLYAEQALQFGEKEVVKLKKAKKQLLGAQRTGLAAQGIVVDSGSARDIQADTEEQSRQDVVELRNNAWREAWGFRYQATAMRGQGRLAALSAKYENKNTLISGGYKALSTGINAFAGGGK